MDGTTSRPGLRDVVHALTRLHKDRLTPGLPTGSHRTGAAELHGLEQLEQQFLDDERACVIGAAATAPDDADAFCAWFDRLRERGPGQGNSFWPWLATSATAAQLRWVLQQERVVEAGFDDVVALTSVRMPLVAKLEMARNHWDELGRGRMATVHAPFLRELEVAFGVDDDDGAVVEEAGALPALMLSLASNHRRFAFHAIGAIGVVELTQPARARAINAALERLSVSGKDRRYYAIHATLGVAHAASWSREVLRPLVAGDARRARAIAEGALMRLRGGSRCVNRYRRVLGLNRVESQLDVDVSVTT